MNADLQALKRRAARLILELHAAGALAEALEGTHAEALPMAPLVPAPPHTCAYGAKPGTCPGCSAFTTLPPSAEGFGIFGKTYHGD